MPRSRNISEWDAPFLTFWREAVDSPVTIHTSTPREASLLRNTLYEVRSALRREPEFDAALAASIDNIRLRVEGSTLVAEPKGHPHVPLLASAEAVNPLSSQGSAHDGE